jgi:DNA-binding MltR family transcriptional regulator
MAKSRNRGVRKPQLRDLSRKQLSSDEAAGILESLGRVSPFVTAILGASLVEHQIEQSIIPRLSRSDESTWSSLTGENGPIATLHQKIIIAFALGVIDATIKTDLGVVKDIRNSFAHARQLLDFDHALIEKEFGKIVIPPGLSGKLKTYCNQFSSFDGNQKYVLLCRIILYKLQKLAISRTRNKLNRAKQRLAKPRKEHPSVIRLLELLDQNPEWNEYFQEPYQLKQNVYPTLPTPLKEVIQSILQEDQSLRKNDT